MTDFTGLNIGIRSYDTIVDGGQVDGCERSQKRSFSWCAMDVGIVHGKCIFNEEYLRGFRVMGKVMDEILHQGTVFDINHFIPIDGNCKILKLKCCAFSFQLVSTNISFIQQRVLDAAFSEEIAAGQSGIFKVKIKRVVRGYAVKGIKLAHLIRRDKGIGIWSDIKLLFAEIDVDPLDNSIEELC